MASSPESPVSSLSRTHSLPGLKDREAGYVTEEKIAMKDKGARVAIAQLAAVPRRKPLPGSTLGYAQHKEDVPVSTKKSLFFGLSMAMLKEEVRFGGNKKKQRLFFCGIAAALVLLVLIIGLAVGLSKKKKSSNLPLPLDNGGPYSGDLTYYEPGLGACGITSAASENVCAVSRILYDAASTGSDPNQNPLCGLKLRLRRGDKSVDVTVVDRCVACEPTDIDVSVSVFEKLALVEQGRVDVEWAWLEKAPVKVPHD
ncbi:riboflavin aldehyde-forming enzyme [Coccidioides immitis RS]|uniref:Riboflavin aldehyde-forming enzyme n=2 Tax=Coccidioides immitis TaxID=5501 RepID=J3K0K0_COCIM|nr:riboflavin aldehyde-forming enzyme [Coccidioides immitis RS]EAS27380.3 riboflavin aldehyde-forming enzyme [Coccidioides immitis RS]TPX20194.1 hypothetical protein DIZ76_016082 [Coccidioides immitis]